ncbi:hypothetical protein CHS0354_030638 [Potamilus streckersoni]|uniref:Serine protease n=1 Tax=Potamilus streckersoni TaxID=2493646 RepID=A0AAE0SM08_9BIVA|nr:hypothetical protein CHS0354_030638 [Potamilus streckersoni]
MDCFGFCGARGCKKKKKTKEKYKKNLDYNEKKVAHPTWKDQEKIIPSDNDPQTANLEIGDPSPHVVPSGAREPVSLDNNVIPGKTPNQSGTKQPQVIGNREATQRKENVEKSKHRPHHHRQESSDSESDSTSEDSSSLDDSDDSPDEKIKGKEMGTNSKTTIINVKGGIVSLGKNSKSKIVQISDGVVNANRKKRRKKKSRRSHKDENPADKAPRHHNESDNNCLGNFRKINDETDAIYNLRLVLKIAESVGIIRSPSVTGTGFRVGESYIMTARHVVMDIINSVPRRLEQPTEDRVKILEDPTVYIDFDYELPDGHSYTPEDRKTHHFNFEPIICYENDVLDAVVLKLKHNNQAPGFNFPPKLVNFAETENASLYFVGHNRGKIKEFDRSTPKENLTGKMFKKLQHWSMQHQVGSQIKRPGYTGADNGSKVLFDCTFNKGASGSPGFIVSKHDHMPYVVTMLLRGYPDWLYDDTVPQEEKITIPKEYIFEQGVCLTEICYDMRFRDPGLAEDIFGPKWKH